MKTNITYLILVVITTICISCESHNQPELQYGFSISETRQVVFSPGNLQYCPKKDIWRFAEHQYDYIGEENIYISQDYEGWIDLFGWGTGNNPTLNTIDTRDYTTFTDWGTNSISGYPQNTWRTLTNDEWNYLLFLRPNASAYYTVAQVNGTNGLILLPDNWVAPNGITFISGYSDKEYSAIAFEEYQSFTIEQWNTMQAAGAVFLPCAGFRLGTSLAYMQMAGLYWTSSPHAAYGPQFASYFLFMCDGAGIGYDTRSGGNAVRLVKDL